MINLKINKDIIETLQNDFKINSHDVCATLFVLFCLYEERVDLLDVLDDSSRSRTMLMFYQQLTMRGLLEKDISSEENCYWSLTDKAYNFIEYCKSTYSDITPVKLAIKVIEEKKIEPVATNPSEEEEVITIDHPMDRTEEEEVITWIKEYINLFPEGKHFERYYRTNHYTVTERMRSFIKTYNYSKDIILKATERKIREFEDSDTGVQKLRNSTYFIKKIINGETYSDLANACQEYLDEQESGHVVSYFNTKDLDLI